MIAVSDTGPIHYLLLIKADWTLPILFERILVPPVVRDELLHPSAPPPVRSWAAGLPAWVELRGPKSPLPSGVADPGEAAAIALAAETGSLLLIDDAQALVTARGMGLRGYGTLGVLQRAHAVSLIEIRTALAALGTTNFRHTPELFSKAVVQAEDMRSHGR